jgi:hypothetical protein
MQRQRADRRYRVSRYSRGALIFFPVSCRLSGAGQTAQRGEATEVYTAGNECRPVTFYGRRRRSQGPSKTTWASSRTAAELGVGGLVTDGRKE